MDASTAIDDAFAQLRRFLVEHAPTAATRLGDHTRDGDLDDWSRDSVAARERELDALARRLDGLAGATAADVDADGDRVLLADTVAALRFELSGRRAHETDPLHYLDVASGGLDDLLRRDDLPPEPRRRALASRLAQVPRLLEQARDALVAVPAPHREVALRRMPSTVALCAEVVPAFAPEAAAAGEAAADACRAFAAWLDDGGDAPAPDWRLGPERWADALRLALGVRMPADEVFARASARLDELQEEAAEHAGAVLAGVGAPDPGPDERVRAALEVVAADTASPQELVATAAGVLDEIEAFLREADLVTLPDDTELVVEEMPGYQQGVAVAFFVPAPPLEEAGAAHTYYLSPIPDDWDAAQTTSFLREYNVHALRSVGIHEALPGHFVQFAAALQHPRLLRRALWNSAFAEGWAVYVEREVVAAGYGGVDAARLRLTNVKMDLRAVANALLDQGLHVAGWDDDRAFDLLCGRAYQERAEATGKLVRGKVTAGQLSSYFVGGEEMADLRRDVEAAQAAAFSARAFHDAVLSHGTPPFAVLRRALLGDEPDPDPGGDP